MDNMFDLDVQVTTKVTASSLDGQVSATMTCPTWYDCA